MRVSVVLGMMPLAVPVAVLVAVIVAVLVIPATLAV
jgi:hypothetical protein